MKKKSETFLFVLVPFVLILLFITSGEKIISILEGTKIASWLYILSYPNAIFFNLGVSYLAGVFIYYLTVYIPNKREEITKDRITYNLLRSIHQNLLFVFDSLLSDSNEMVYNNISLERFKEICDNYELDKVQSEKYSITNRSSLQYYFEYLELSLKNLDTAVVYIKPDIYNLCLLLKESHRPDYVRSAINASTGTLTRCDKYFHRIHLIYKVLGQNIKELEATLSSVM